MARVHQSHVSADDAGMVERVVRMYCWVACALQEATLSVKRLRDVLCGAGRTPKTPPASAESLSSSDVLGQGEGALVPVAEAAKWAGEPGPLESAAVPQPTGGHRAGTGRLGADASVGAERTECRHEAWAVGQRCPVCGQGTLEELPPGVEVRIDDHALLSAMRYALHTLRCAACGQMFTAPLPREAGEEKFRARARAVLVMCRYSLGLPLSRLQDSQAMQGVPVPDATQWDQIEKVGDWSYVVFASLETLAAQGELISQDDTSVRRLTLSKENDEMRAQAEALGVSRAKERTGMCTTAWVVKGGERPMCLYSCGRAHAGENLAALVAQRQADRDKPVVLSDALSRNEVDEASVMRCHCLAPGCRQCSDITEVFPVECQVVIDVRTQVFAHDAEARDRQMSPEARLLYHQEASRPLMEERKRWLDRQRDERLVAPTSAVGKAIASRQGHWATLTRFLEVAGAPLENHLVERALKLCIRQRNTSLVSRTESSASLASVLTSLIATCLHAGVKALESLVALHEHRSAVCAEPVAWLPWT